MNKNHFQNFKINDIIKFVNDEYKNDFCFMLVTNIDKFDTFKNYLENKGLQNCLPNIKNIDDGLNEYYKFNTLKDEVKYGVVSFSLKKLNYKIIEERNITKPSIIDIAYVSTIDEAYELCKKRYYDIIDGENLSINKNILVNGILPILKDKYKQGTLNYWYDDIPIPKIYNVNEKKYQTFSEYSRILIGTGDRL